jgi:putative flippase GtrA
MADEKKKFSLGGIDSAAEEKGSFFKTLWQIIKFLVVSGLVTIIQLGLALLLPYICDQITAVLPEFLRGIFTPAMFATGSKEATKYVIDGVVTWGYVLPFLLSNLIANIYGFYQNKKTTFKSDAPWYNFAIYIVLMIALILFSTWMQGAIVSKALMLEPTNFITKILSNEKAIRLIASLFAGFVQMVVLFPIEKFVLLKEKKEEAPEEAPAQEAAE